MGRFTKFANGFFNKLEALEKAGLSVEDALANMKEVNYEIEGTDEVKTAYSALIEHYAKGVYLGSDHSAWEEASHRRSANKALAKHQSVLGIKCQNFFMELDK